MSQTDKLKLARFRQVSRNAEFEDPTDPFHPAKHRFQLEMNRYLETVNLKFMPPMPKPPKTRNSNYPGNLNIKERDLTFIKSKRYSASNLSETNVNNMTVTQTTNYS